MATSTLTSRNHLTVLTVGASVIPGNWKTIAGGALTAENTKNRPGGMEAEESIPGVPTREDLTITREYKLGRDAGLVGPGGTLETALKQGTESAVTSHDMGHDAAVPTGSRARVYRGSISSVSVSDLDSESSEVKTITVVLSVVA